MIFDRSRPCGGATIQAGSVLTGSAVPPQQDDHSAIFGSAGIQLTPKAIELKLAVDVVTDAA
ncbi:MULTISPECIES: hypothetical protein [unclassified Mesorhizobium]|uniref:hypothetical protein n=1 Tax=unclassified Mesorhizobium TaxID=325217 RepID=UPI0003CE7C78|nr:MULTISPECIES: hypothetical protein [unclassified Mesorhizobium]ESX14207.1 hypothetical protein X766_27620 [Mesorhizobium sp. LSJC255A00]ESX44905.1 hypothetical protein X764_01360 [Mesorhizobium sp. LSHC440A00]ESX80011.1 hypothetical protein X757_03440 [Mesorhizobium sp. LSHC414A00]ESY44105.1 hypothetical protein X747_09045 [Mesorhizobium sp. LNJC384A00]WJI59719.1 hypothetical protein NLY33_13840 [Mesorhizobium sp. C432A]